SVGLGKSLPGLVEHQLRFAETIGGVEQHHHEESGLLSLSATEIPSGRHDQTGTGAPRRSCLGSINASGSEQFIGVDEANLLLAALTSKADETLLFGGIAGKVRAVVGMNGQAGDVGGRGDSEIVPFIQSVGIDEAGVSHV